MKLPLIEVVIRRDSQTIIPVTVPPHELIILREMFGHENVQNEKPVSTIEIDENGEFDRLCAKYNPAQITEVFGKGGLMLRQHIEAAEIKRGRPSAEKPKDADPRGTTTPPPDGK